MTGPLLALLLASARVPTPVLSPPGGSYTAAQSVTVASPATGDTIYCTTDGSLPRRAASQRYAGPIALSSSATVRCRAFALDGREPSRLAAASYTIDPGPAASGWAAACAAEPIRSTGTRYYVCDCLSDAYGSPDAGCVAGSDANSGTSASSPLRTWSAAAGKFRSMQAGDTVALCKGGRWAASGGNSWGSWVNSSCSAGNPCVVREYQAAWGGTNKPRVVITGGGYVMPIGQTGTGSAAGGYRILNLALVQNTPLSPGGSEAMPITGRVSDLEVCNTTFDGHNIHIEGNLGDCSVLASGGGYRRHFRGNQFLNSCQHGILIESWDSDFDGNFFDNNGNDDCYSPVDDRLKFQNGGTNHTFYLQAWCGAHNVRFINNEIRRQGIANYSGVLSPTAQAVNLNGGDVQNMVIENNLIDMRPSHSVVAGTAAIKAVHGYGPATPWGGLVIRRNRILGGSGAPLQVFNAPGALIEDNLLVMDGGSLNSEPMFTIPWVPSGSDTTTSATVRNNTLYLQNMANVQGIGFLAGGVAGGHNLTGNSVTFVGGSGNSCYRVDDATRLAFMDRNHCYGASVGYSAGVMLTSPPAFVAAPSDLTPASGSPLVGAASTATTCAVAGTAGQPCSSPVALDSPTWSPTAAAKARSDGAPDIGAMER